MSNSDFDVSNSSGSGGIVPTYIPIPALSESLLLAGALQLSLVSLDKMVRIDQLGLLSSEQYNPCFETWDAVAQCNVPLETFRSMFVFQTDHFDVDDICEDDVRFYIDSFNIPNTEAIGLPTAIVGNGKVSSLNAAGTALLNSDLVIGKDYIRHLANRLFNTPFGVDLFINEEDLVTSVNNALNKVWTSCAQDLQDISNTGQNENLQGVENYKYLSATDCCCTCNFGSELFDMLVSRDPSRFTDLTSLVVDSVQATRLDPAARNLYKLPLKVGDQILIRVGLKPHPTQDSFQGSTKDDEIRDNLRVYIILLNLV
jgi:hypothetical protein